MPRLSEIILIICAIPYTLIVGTFLDHMIRGATGSQIGPFGYIVAIFSYYPFILFISFCFGGFKSTIEFIIEIFQSIMREFGYLIRSHIDEKRIEVSAKKNADRIAEEEEKRRIGNENYIKQQQIQSENLRLQYELNRPAIEQAKRDEQERIAAQKRQEEEVERESAKNRALEIKNQQEEHERAMELAAEKAYWNSPEGRQVRAARGLLEIEIEKAGKLMELELEKERKIAEIKRQALEDDRRITEELYNKAKDL